MVDYVVLDCHDERIVARLANMFAAAVTEVVNRAGLPAEVTRSVFRLLSVWTIKYDRHLVPLFMLKLSPNLI